MIKHYIGYSLDELQFLARDVIYTGCANKKQSPSKNAVFQPWYYEFAPNFQTLYANIHPTYPANFIEITDIVPRIQQFKL